MTEVWALAMAGALVLLALVGLAVLADRPRNPRPDPVRLRAAAEDLTTHAVRIRTEAGRAAAVANGARAALTTAERARDEAWAVLDAAERHYTQVRRTVIAAEQAAAARPTAADPVAQQPSESDGRTPDTERDRVVSRAALSAYRRGDISLPELREVFRRTGDWDPLTEERNRALEHARMRLATARREYDRTALVARRAEQSAWVAEVAARALLEEAEQSAVEADEALQLAQRHTRRRDRRRNRRGAATGGAPRRNRRRRRN
ncbi:hypothetical protein [Plantactinospora sonchi]|uniref:Uncharacterized protein n=1 Tax=Plantactinospora sonchi TaxID=1544735 RepID=A0ABU7RLT0_9ACTN